MILRAQRVIDLCGERIIKSLIDGRWFLARADELFIIAAGYKLVSPRWIDIGNE